MSPQLPTRKLGKNGPQVTALGFGTMGLSTFYGEVGSDEERFKILDRAYELGQTHWDTADLYGDSEDLLGKWFKKTGKRNEIFLATKFAGKLVDGQIVFDSSPEHCKAACAKSLQRLGVDYIDLYYCHRTSDTPIEKTVQAMVDLKNEGKIRHIGLSEVSSETLRRASKIDHIDALQIEYSPFCLDIESPATSILQTCRTLGTAIVAYSPLGRGLLTGAYTSPSSFSASDFRHLLPRFSEENFPKNLKLVEELKEMAEKKGCTSGQLVLAWLLAQGDDVIPIPGTKKIKYLEENLGAFGVVLSEGEVADIREKVERAEVHGERYGDAMMAYVFSDTPPL